MSTDGRSTDASDGFDVRSANFVRLVTRADGDALAASGLVARALAERGTPFQLTVGRTVAERTHRSQAVADESAAGRDLTLVVGAVDADVPRLDTTDRPATLAAVDLVRGLDVDPDPILALAGLVAAGVDPGAGESEWILETAQERGLVERRPGVAVPTRDPVDGITHSTRLCAPWSGDPDAVRETLESADVPVDSVTDLDGDDQRAIGSLVALDAVGTDEATATAAEAVERVLRPYATPDGPFETVGGYADVLEASARTEPGTGAAFAMGHGAREPTLDAWREHGRNAHDALSAASTGRYDGLFVVGVDDGPVETVARIAAAYRSPEPAALAVGNGEVGLVTRARDPIAATVERIARDLADATLDSSEAGDGSEPTVEYDVGRRRGYLRYDRSLDDSTVIETVRGVL
ncbi:exonuclease [Natrialba sp. INN-245]|uniref:exonuclease n=1 Tax=Natrialba sp. INN-245 TaxID=2690967 RepID=UPI0013102214|nr:exonuclease [Natrialba sp. INN-245]MWV39505.1 exonuclease [Natrialba sp. INN-245]